MTHTQTITVTLRLFALYRERLGRDRMEMALPVSATVAEAMTELARLHPQLLPLVQPTRVAVNQEYASPDQPLRQGDELVLIPPVSGGQGTPCTHTMGVGANGATKGEHGSGHTAGPFPRRGGRLGWG